MMSLRIIPKINFQNLENNKTIHIISIIFFICISYSNSIYSPFILDDFHSFINNQNLYINNISIDSLEQLSKTEFGVNRLIPLLTFALDHLISNGNIIQYHITNIIIHVATAITIYFLIINLLSANNIKLLVENTNKRLFAFMVSAIWALNPVQTNAVTYLVQRMTSMAALFYIAAILMYVKTRKSESKNKKCLYILLCVAFSVFSFVSKENSATLPIAIWMIEYFFFNNEIFIKFLNKIKPLFIYASVALLTLLLPPFYYTFNNMISGYATRSFTLTERLLTESRVISYFISLLLAPFPWRLNIDYDFPISKSLISPPQTIISILTIFIIIMTCVRLRKKLPLVAFGFLFFFLNLIIESTFVPLEIIFEHRLYLPSVGFFIGIVSLIDIYLFKLNNIFSKKILKDFLLCFVILLISALSILTTYRNYDWKDTFTLYTDALSKSPDKPRTLVNAGLSFARNNQYDKAIELFEKSISNASPGNEESMNAANNILVALIKQKKYSEAIEYANKFRGQIKFNIKIGSYNIFFHNLGISYYFTGDYANALKNFEKSCFLDEERSLEVTLENIKFIIYTLVKIDEMENNISAEQKEVANADAIYGRLLSILLRCRKYTFAKDFLTKVDANKNKNLNLSIRNIYNEYKSDMQKNITQARLTNISSSNLYTNDYKYKVTINLIQLSGKYYKFAQPYFIKLLANRYPKDHWATYLLISQYFSQKEYEKAMNLCNEHHYYDSNFPPELEMLADLLVTQGKPEKAVPFYEKILNIYPGHPRWRNFTNIIEKYNTNLDSQDIQSSVN